MCGRHSLTPNLDEFDIGVRADPDHVEITDRYNIAPTQPVAVVVPTPSKQRMLTAMRRGIIPQWMKPTAKGKPPAGWINARAETASAKPAFSGAFKYRRCIVPAMGFYEWEKRVDGPKQPWLMRGADDKTLSFAGQWETWCHPTAASWTP